MNRLLIFFCAASIPAYTQSIIYPKTDTVDVTDNYFGRIVKDPYRWLEYDTSTEVVEWRKEQSQFAKKYLKKNIPRFETKASISQHTSFSRVSLAHAGDPGGFFYRNEGGVGIGLYFTKKGATQLVIRPSRYGIHKSISFFVPSNDQRLVAIGLSNAGSDWDEVRVKNLVTEEMYPEVIKGIKMNAVFWHGNGFYYCRYALPDKKKLLTAKNTELKIFFHEPGENQQNDKLICSESDQFSIEGMKKTDDERYLIIYGKEVRKQQTYTRLMYIDFADHSFTEPRVFIRVPEADFKVVASIADSLILVSDYKAPQRRIYTCNPKKANRLNLIIPDYQETLDHVSLVDNKLVCLYKEHTNFMSVVFDLKGEVLHSIKFEPGWYITGFSGSKGQTTILYDVHTFTSPRVTYEYDLRTFKVKLISFAGNHFKEGKLTTSQHFYTSKDGTKIPIYIVHKDKFKIEGNAPCLVYGYGGYGISMTPFYDPGLIYFLEQGGVLAAPCIRGGGEYGESWHKGGSLLNKQNSFDDFIAAAEYMISEKYTNSSKLAMMGGSNGGLVVGAVLTQRPELFKVAVAEAGAFDMLRYQNYTQGFRVADEYGLSSDSIQFNNLIKYSPVHNVKKANYPSTLLIAGDHDDRVPPMHSFKFAASLQKNNTGANPILLLVNKNAGHQGPNDYDDYMEESTFKYGFILSELSGDK